MLQAQVNYWSLQEQIRHNKESEKLGYDTLAETSRHNIVGEELSRGSLNESIRHNKATESLNWASLGETRRHNKTVESQQWRQLGISDFEATTHREDADTRRMEYELKTDQFEWSKFEYSGAVSDRNIRSEQAAASTKQAQAAEANAATNQRQADIAQQEADTQQYRAETDRGKLWFNIISDIVHSAINVHQFNVDQQNRQKGK